MTLSKVVRVLVAVVCVLFIGTTVGGLIKDYKDSKPVEETTPATAEYVQEIEQN